MTDRFHSPIAWAGFALKTPATTSGSRSPAVARSGLLRVAALAISAALLSGCAAWPKAGNNGLFYTQVTTPFAVLDAEANASRTGKACSTGLLGLIATGNTSIETAMETAGITKISTVEESFTHFLFGAYSSYCTIVKGS